MFELGGGKKGELRFLIDLENCCVVLVEILKCSHLFGEGDYVLQLVDMVKFTSSKWFL
jgi:hypothetical protein